MKKIKIRMGKRIKELRKLKRMTLVRLSEKSGVQLATLSRIENNKMTGSLESHAQICLALGIKLSELYEGVSLDGEDIGLRLSGFYKGIF